MVIKVINASKGDDAFATAPFSNEILSQGPDPFTKSGDQPPVLSSFHGVGRQLTGPDPRSEGADRQMSC